MKRLNSACQNYYLFRFDRTNIRRQYNSFQIFNISLTLLSMNYIFYRLNAVSIQ